MVAIVSGNGLGVSLSSLSTLGNNAAAGAAAQGHNGELAFVDIANGNLILQDHDAAQSALGAIPLDSLRVYNSEGTLDATDNWTNGFQMQRVALASGSLNGANSSITRTDTDGAVATYTYANGVYTTTAGGGGYDTITYNATTLTFTRVDTTTGATERYDSSGKLVSLADAKGNTFTYAYNGAGLVTSVKDAAGVVRTYYDYDTSNRLTQIRTVSATGAVTSLVHYVFDSANRLTSVSVDLSPADSSITDGKVYTTTYAYTSATSKQLQSVTQSDGSSLTFAYVPNDPTFRLQSVTDNLGNKTSFTYDAVNRKTTVTDANNQSTVYSYDAGGQLLSVAVPSAAGTATTSYTYNGNGDLTQVVDPSGRTIVMTYDANGNQVSQMDAAGNTITRTFDANKQLATETAWVVPDPDGTGAGQPGTPMTTRYVYDAASGHQLRFVLSPEGRVTQYVYNATNQRVATITYPTAAYAVGSLGATAVPTEAQMTSWVATLDLTQSVRADVTYDVVGNVSQTVAWAKVDSTGAGVSDGTQSTSKYVYDQYGHLLQIVKPGAGTTNFTYDGLGRVLTQQDANGTATNVYDDANNKVVATAVNGLITTSTYDKANRLVSLVQGTSTTPVIGQTTYAYDADGNLLMTTDPDGNRTFALYDAARRLVATVDATGLLTERVYNLAGQVVETIRYATAVSLSLLVDGTGKALNPALSAIRPTGTSYAAWTLYDTAGRVSKQIDAAGYVTETRYDGASRVTDVIGWANAVAIAGISVQTLATAAAATPTADSANDRRTRTFYDNDGNVAGTLDAEGYLTENVYDAAGRVVHTIRYAVATASANRATGTLATLRPAADNVHDIHGWNYYNDESQLVGSVDGEGYLTEYSYDLDGHLVKTVRHAAPALVAPTAITSTTTLAALRPTVTTGDQVTQSVYNGLGQLTSSTNAEGTVTQYTYDTAGNVLTAVVAASTADVRTDTRQYDAQGHLLADLGGVGSAALAALGASPTAAQVANVWSTYGTSYAYDAAGLRISATDAAGNKTLYYYDVDGRATHTVNALGEVEETTYNVLGQVVATTNIGTRISTTGLTGGIDTAALLSAITAAKNATLDSKVSYTYLAQGAVGTKTDELGDLTTYTYNAFGQATLASQAIGGGANVAHKVDYDRRGQVKDTQENSVDEVTAYVYDAFGRAVTVTDPNGNLTNTTFDRLGRSTQVTGPLFVTSQNTFDAFGRVLTVGDANGNATTYVYDDVARTIKVTDLYGVAVMRTHDREGETISILDGNGNTTTYAYDLDGRLKDAIVDPGSGHLALDTHTDYDGAGRIADTVDASGNKVTYTYDAVNRVFKRTEGANASMNIVTTYTYDAKGQLISQQDPDNVLTGITYDLAGNVLTKTVDTAGLKLKTTNTYDVRGNLLTTTDPSGVITTYGYNAIGRRISQQVDTTLNLLTQYGYDGDGNVTRVIDPDGNVTLNAYDKAGRLLYSQDGTGNVTGYTYDNDGRVLTSTRYAKAQTALVASVTANGTVNIAVTAPTVTAGQDQTTTYTYDTNGRKTLSEVDKAGLDLKTQYFYDGAGNLTKVVDPNGAATLYIYDAANRVTSALSPAGTLTQTVYDGDGHVAQTTVYSGAKAMTTTVASNGRVSNAISGTITPSANDVVTAYTYDAANRRKTATVDPSGLALKTSYAYDAAGNLTQVTDPAGNITYYGYDAAGRRRYVLDPQNILTETVYDGAGRVTASIVYGTAPTGLSATPNAAGLVTPTFTVVGSATLDRVTRYGYDAAGRQVYALDAQGNVTETAYDAAGLVTGVRRYATAIALPATGSADGRTLAMTTAAIKAAITTSAADITTRYAYDAAGRKVFTVAGTGAVTGYSYDAFDQLAIQRTYATAVTQPAWGTAFAAAAITTALGAANAADRLTRFGYDNAGRTLYSVDALGVVTASTYDADSHLIKTQVYHAAITLPTDGSALTGAAIAAKLAATAGTDVVTRYAYDADGRQVYAVDAMGFATATTYDSQGRVRARTVYAAPITLPSTPGAAMSASDITAALHPSATADQVTRYVVDDAGRVTWIIDPLGRVTANQYDKDGNLTQKKEYSVALNNSAMALVINASDFTVTVTPATDRVTRYFYDGDNRLRFEIDALGYVTETAYQADRTVTTQYAGLPNTSAAVTTANVATAVGAVANAALDHKTIVLQDKDGRSADTTTPDGVTSRDVYDAFGRVAFHYDALGLPEQAVTAYVYDAAGRVTSKTSGYGKPEAQTTLTYYNALGDVDTVVSPDGYALANLDTTWAQAERARLGMPAAVASLTAAQRTEMLARYTTKFTYDADGRTLTTTTAYLATTAKSSSSTTKYDAFGNAVKVVDPLGNAGYFYFDKLGRVIMQVDPLLNVVQTVYTGGFSDKVASVRRYVNKAAPGTNETAAPTPATNALDVVTTYTYDKLGRVLTTVNASGTADQSTESITWRSSDGNIFNKVVTNKLGGATTYVYDRDGQELSETLPVTSLNAGGSSVAVVNSFTYDAFGNRTSSIEGAGLPEQRTTLYKYDAMGRVVYRIGASYQAFMGFNTDGTVKTQAVTPVDYTHYDALGRVIETLTGANWSGTAASGGVRTLNYYDSVGNVLMSIAADGAVTRNTFTTSGKTWQSFAYATAIALPAAAGGTPPTPTVDAINDRVRTFKYDVQDRLIDTDLNAVIYWEQTNPTGAIVLDLPNTSPKPMAMSKTVYDLAGNAVQQIDGRGNSTYTYYDALGRKILSIDAGGYATAWDYGDVFDSPTQQIQYSTALVSTSYVGQPMTAAQAAALRATLDGTTPAATSPNRVTTYTLDRQGRVHERRLKNVAFDYVAADGTRSTHTADSVTDFTYDALGDVTEQSDRVAELSDNTTNVWNVTDFTYDKLGRITNEKDPGYTDYTGTAVRPSTDTVYDALGNVTRTTARSTDGTDANSRITSSKYDANGNLVQSTDANGNVTQYLYDFNMHVGLSIALGQQSASGTLLGVLDGSTKFLGVLDADNVGSTDIKYFAYDAAGRQIRQTDKNTGQVSNTRYNAFGEITGKGLGYDATTGLAAYQEFTAYNVMGKVERSNTGDGVTKLYLYDLNGNATQQIQSSATDLTSVSIVTAATDTTLQHTFSIYDSRNNLTRTVEPDISFQQDQITTSAAYTQQLTPLLGAITMGDAAPGTYASGTSDNTGYSMIQVGGESGSSPLPTSTKPTPGAVFVAPSTPAEVPAPQAMVNQFTISPNWQYSGSGLRGGPTGQTSFPVPSYFPGGVWTYRIFNANTNSAGPTAIAGQSLPIAVTGSTNYTQFLQASNDNGATWTQLGKIENYYHRTTEDWEKSYDYSPTVTQMITGISNTSSFQAYTNYGTPSQASASALVTWINGSTMSLSSTASPVTLITTDATGITSATLVTSSGTSALPQSQAWLDSPTVIHFSASVLTPGGGSTTLYYRQASIGANWSAPTSIGTTFSTGGLARGITYEYVLSSSRGDLYGQFTLDGSGNITFPATTMNGSSAPAGFGNLSALSPNNSTFSMNFSGSPALGAASSYTFTFNYNGMAVSNNASTPSAQFNFNLSQFGVSTSRFAIYGGAYSYTIMANMADGRQQLVGQGSGAMSGADNSFSSNADPTTAKRPIAYLTLPSSTALTGTVLVGGVGIGINSTDSRVLRTTDSLGNPVLAIDMTDWVQPSGATVSISYNSGDAVFSGSFAVAGDGTVSPKSFTSNVRQPYFPISVAAATTLTQFTINGSDATSRIIQSGGGTWVINAGNVADAFGNMADGVTRSFSYTATNAGGIVGQGTGTFTVQPNGAMSYTFDTPTLRPSVMTFPMPSNAQHFTVSVRAHGTNNAFVPLFDGSVTGGSTKSLDVSSLRPSGSSAALYDYVYTATYTDAHNATQRASSGTGVLTVNTNGTTSETNVPDRGPLRFFGPAGEHVPLLAISSPSFTTAKILGDWDTTNNCMVYVWDVLGLQPQDGTTAQFNVTLTMLNTDGTPFLNELGKPIIINGVMTLGAGASGATVQQYVSELPVSAQVAHNQTFDAFGEIASEFDDTTLQRANADVGLYGGMVDASALQTTFVYNVEGKLIQKIDPQTNVTLANGFRQRVRPVTTYGYDLEGRLVSTLDANNNLSRENYAGAGERLSQQWAADGGHKEIDYDIFGSERKDTDELGVVTSKTVDKMGNLVEADLQGVARVANDTGSNKVGSTITDLYVVDAFGQRVKHTNAMLGVDKTYYDSLGRVVKTVTAAGRATTYSYTFVPFAQNPGITGNGQASIGGYQLVTGNPDGTTTTDNINYFGVTTWHVDEGGHTFMYIYDVAGHLTEQTSSAGQDIFYKYYANGDLAEERDVKMKTMTRYGYDNAGNRIWEQYSGLDSTNTKPQNIYQSSTLVYDELNRLIRVQDVAADIQYQFDAVGNRRAVHAIYWDQLAGLRQTDDLWYTYDAVNRFTMTKGSLSGHATSANDSSAYIVQGAQGVKITYDLRGERKTARNADGAVETYNYSADGFLEDTFIGTDSSVGVLRARRRVDALGRTFEYLEYSAASALITDQTSTYDGDSHLQATADKVNNTTTKYFYFLDKTNNQSTATQSGAGALAHVDLTPSSGSGTSTIYTYDYWETARQTTIKTQVVGQTAAWATGLSQLNYDVNGYLYQAKDNASGRTLTYINSAHGLVIKRIDQTPGQKEVDDYWYYANDHVVGDVSTSATENATRTSYAEQLAITEAQGKEAKDSHKKNAPASPTSDNVDFDENYQPINSGYPAATGTAYTVHNGDTLKSIAKNIWGDASMWYLIAQANNLTGSETLVQGQILQIPNKVANIHNNAETFKPYNPGEVIGDINPTLPDPPPPAQPGKGCGTIGTIIMVVVAIVATIYTAGAAAGLLAEAAATTTVEAAAAASTLASVGATMSAGAAVLTSAGSLAGLAAAAIGGAVGSIASQAVGDAMGNTHGFSWKQVATSAIGSVVTAGVGWGMSTAFPTAAAASTASFDGLTTSQAIQQGAERVAYGVGTAVASSAVQQALKGEWSWRQIAASAVGAAAGQAAGGAMSAAVGNIPGASIASEVARSMGGGWASQEVMATDPRNPKPKLSSLFVSALGSAIGDAAAGYLQSVGPDEDRNGMDLESDQVHDRAMLQQGIDQSDAIQRAQLHVEPDQSGTVLPMRLSKNFVDSWGFTPHLDTDSAPPTNYSLDSGGPINLASRYESVTSGQTLMGYAGGDKEFMGRLIVGMHLTDPNKVSVGADWSPNDDISGADAIAVANRFLSADGQRKTALAAATAAALQAASNTNTVPGSCTLADWQQQQRNFLSSLTPLGSNSYEDSPTWQRIQGGVLGGATTVVHMAGSVAYTGANLTLQIGDILTLGYAHDNPYMQEAWVSNGAIANGVVNLVTSPRETFGNYLDSLDTRWQTYKQLEQQGRHFDAAVVMGNLGGDVALDALTSLDGLKAVTSAGAYGARRLGLNDFVAGSGEIPRGPGYSQRGMISLDFKPVDVNGNIISPSAEMRSVVPMTTTADAAGFDLQSTLNGVDNNEAHSAFQYQLLKRDLLRQEIANPGDSMSGPVVFKDPVKGATPDEVDDIRNSVDIFNLALDEGYMSPTGRVSTNGALRIEADAAAAAERKAAEDAGDPYTGVAGHGPDTTWSGLAKPPFWLDLSRSINSSLGRQAQNYPIGYKPTRFVYQGDL